MNAAVRRLSFVLALAPSLALAQEQPPADEESSGEAAPTGEDDASREEPPAGESGEAEDLEGLEALLDERVVTTASRGAERASAAPATVFTITAREMHVFGIRTVDEALSYLGVGVYVMRARDYATGIDVGAQGIVQRDGGRHILVLLDGHVMNSQDTGQVTLHEGLGVPLEAIDHLEVMLGAGSVAYGSNALIAVINVITRRPSQTPGTVHAIAELGLAPPQDERGLPSVPDRPGDRVGLRYRFGLGFTRSFELLGSPAEIAVWAEWVEEISNSYRMAPTAEGDLQLRPGETEWGGPTVHGMRAPSVVLRLRVGDFRLSLQANHYFRNMPLTGTFSDPLAREERNVVRADLRHEVALVPQATLTTRFYADYTTQAERTMWTSYFWCFEGQIDGCSFDAQSVGRWAGVEQLLAIDWNLDAAIVTTIGYDVRGRDTTSRPADSYDIVTGDAPLSERLPYIHQVTVLGAVFAQQVIRPWEWLTLNAGARVDMDSLFGVRLSPRAAAVVTPLEGTSIRASYSEAFRAPTSYELYENDRTYRIPALGLRPEIVRTGELEWQQRFDFVRFGLRGFVAFYEDFIDTRAATPEEIDDATARGDVTAWADPSYLVRYDNLASLRSFGGSLDVSVRPLRGLTIAGSFTYQHTRVGDERIPLTPEWMGNARISYELSPDGASFALAAVFSGARLAWEDLYASDLHEVGESLDLRATVASPIELVPGLRFRATVSYSINPYLPYLISAPTEDAPASPVLFYPVTSSLFGFLGLQYDVDL